MAQLPSDDEIREAIRELIPKVDLQTTGMKTFVKMLGKHMGTNLRPRKVFVKEALTEAINAMEEENEEEDDTRDDEDDSGEEHVPASKPRKKGGGGLAAKKEISPQLAAFLGKGGEMSRTEIVKELWNYIKENDLQSPNDKRKILLDDRMQQVFGCKEFTMFTMNKYVGAHVHPFKPVDLTTSSTPSTAKKRKRKGSTEKGEKKKRKSGTQPPYRLSDELVAVLGKSVLPRPQVVSGIWDYIKSNELQNPNDKREIICDATLKAVMKKDKVTMFSMNQLITPHLLERVDKADFKAETPESD